MRLHFQFPMRRFPTSLAPIQQLIMYVLCRLLYVALCVCVAGELPSEEGRRAAGRPGCLSQQEVSRVV